MTTPSLTNGDAALRRKRRRASCWESTPSLATQTLQRQYEAFIREAPEQWMLGAPEVGLIATAITRWRGLVRRKAIVAAITCRFLAQASSAAGSP